MLIVYNKERFMNFSKESQKGESERTKNGRNLREIKGGNGVWGKRRKRMRQKDAER